MVNDEGIIDVTIGIIVNRRRPQTNADMQSEDDFIFYGTGPAFGGTHGLHG